MDYVNLSAEVKWSETICTACHHNLKHKKWHIIHQYCAIKDHTKEEVALLQNDVKNLEDPVNLNAKHSNNFLVEIDTCIEDNY